MVSNARQLAQVPSVPSGRRNLIINGAMNVAQRGDDIAVNGSGVYSSPDRFRVQQNANSNSSLDQVTDVPSGEGFEYALKYTNGTGEPRNGGDFARCYYRVEAYDSNHLHLGSSNAKAVTLSFWVKSSLTGTFGVGLAGGATGDGVYGASYTINSADTWEYKTISIPAGTINVNDWTGTNGIGVQVHWDLGEGPDRSTSLGWNSSANPSSMGLTGGVKLVETTGATWFLTGVQLEVGTVATEFEHRSYAEELQLCQRYFEYASEFQLHAQPVWFYSGTGASTRLHFVVPKRTTSYTVGYAGTIGTGSSDHRIYYSGAYRAFTSMSFSSSGRALKSMRLDFTGVTGGSAGGAAGYYNVGSSTIASHIYVDDEM